jgi:hypothetical protein
VVFKLSAAASCYIANTTVMILFKIQRYMTNSVYLSQALKLKTAQFAHIFHAAAQNKKQLRPQIAAELGLRNGTQCVFCEAVYLDT